MASPHKNLDEYAPLARSLGPEAFASRFSYPFLLGREVLEEEFRFSTLVTDEPSMMRAPKAGDVFRIRHWVIAIKKPAAAAGQDRIFLGRAESNDICVPHMTVSKLHAYFQRDAMTPSKWFVVDAGSANGTKHNGMRTPPRAKVVLVDGDTVVFGRCVFQFLSARSLCDRVLAISETSGTG